MRLKLFAIVGFVCCLGHVLNAQAPIDLSRVHVVNAPNVLGWPVTTSISRLELRASGAHAEFDKAATWPEVTPPGWEGPLQYTLWLFLNIGGDWYASGIIQFYKGQPESGGGVWIDNQIARNWVYDARWSSMVSHQPATGELVGFMVSAGNARGQDDHVVMERSGIVLIPFPDRATSYPPFTWQEGTSGPPIVTPPVTTPPVVPPAPPIIVTPPDLSGVTARLDAITQQLTLHEAQSATRQQELKAAIDNPGYVMRILGNRYVQLALAGIGTYFTTRQMVQP